MQQKNEADIHCSNKNTKKSAYSCYFEVQLDYVDFGKSRNKHNNLCNQLLLKQLAELNKEGIELCTEVSNEELIKNIRLYPQLKPHRSLLL